MALAGASGCMRSPPESQVGGVVTCPIWDDPIIPNRGCMFSVDLSRTAVTHSNSEFSFQTIL